MKKHKKTLLIVLALIIFGASIFAGYVLLGNSSSGPISLKKIADNLTEAKKDVENPLNGELYTQSESDAWQNRPVLGVMIENLGISDVRPQAGLGSAEVVYETLTEGGITRFMALFLAHESKVGPIRSARLPFLDWISEYDGIYTHVGGSTEALNAIPGFGIKDMNDSGPPTFVREPRPGVGTEHTMFSTTEKLWGRGQELDYTEKPAFTPWGFKDEIKSTDAHATASANLSSSINVEFTGDELYNVQWTYDSDSNSYLRSNGGEPHLDRVTNKQIAPKNVVVQFVPIDLYHEVSPGKIGVQIDNIGTGKVLIFQDGKTIEGKWTKSSRVGRTTFVDTSGAPIQFVRGQIWLQIVPENADITY